VTGAARNSFAKLMDKLQVFFNQPLCESGFRDKSSLVRMLGDGLNQQLALLKPKEKLHLSSSQVSYFALSYEFDFLPFCKPSHFH
jgi:hypothetical protein